MAPRDIVTTARPASLDDVHTLLERAAALGGYTASPADWRDEVLYFLLPDRFSDGREDTRELLTQTRRAVAADDAGAARHRLARVGGLRRALAGRHHRRHPRPARLPAGPRRDHAVDRPGLQAAGPARHLPRLRRPGLPRGRSAVRLARGSRRPVRGRARPRPARHPRHHRQPHRRQLGLRAARGRPRRAAQRAAVPALPAVLRRGRRGRRGLEHGPARRAPAGLDDGGRRPRRRLSDRAARGAALHARRQGLARRAAASTTRTPSTSAPTSSR